MLIKTHVHHYGISSINIWGKTICSAHRIKQWNKTVKESAVTYYFCYWAVKVKRSNMKKRKKKKVFHHWHNPLLCSVMSLIKPHSKVSSHHFLKHNLPPCSLCFVKLCPEVCEQSLGNFGGIFHILSHLSVIGGKKHASALSDIQQRKTSYSWICSQCNFMIAIQY